MLGTVLSALTACSASTPSAKAPIVLPALPIEVGACESGVVIPTPKPGTKLSQLEVERLWMKDRRSLRSCRLMHGATLQFYENLRANLAATGK